MKYRINLKPSVSIRAILFFCLLFPFFQPMSINLLVNQVSQSWKVLDYAYDAAKMAFASVGYIVWLYKRSRRIPDWLFLLLCHMAALVVSAVMAGNGTADALRQFYLELGFVVLAWEMVCESRDTFLRAALAVFAVYTAWGVLTIYLFPYGFFGAGSVYEAIYGLGAKNNSFPTFFAFFFFLIALRLETGTPVTADIVALILLTILAGLICESANTVLCLGMVAVLVLLAVYCKPLLSKLNVKLLLLILAVIMVFIYSGKQFALVSKLLSLAGRKPTFSGRDVLWQQAIEYFKENPVFGAGFDSIFTLASGREASHAHSQWMDKLAKYGILPAVFVAPTIYLTFHRIRKHKDKYRATIYGLLLLIYLFHMSFDTYNYNFFTMFLIVINISLYPPAPAKLYRGRDSKAV